MRWEKLNRKKLLQWNRAETEGNETNQRGDMEQWNRAEHKGIKYQRLKR